VGFEESWRLPWKTLPLGTVAKTASEVAERIRASHRLLLFSENPEVTREARAASSLPEETLPNSEHTALLEPSHPMLSRSLIDVTVTLSFEFPVNRRLEVCDILQALEPKGLRMPSSQLEEDFEPPRDGGENYTVDLDVVSDTECEEGPLTVLRLSANESDNKAAIWAVTFIRNVLAGRWGAVPEDDDMNWAEP
jgi:hypothetical protein